MSHFPQLQTYSILKDHNVSSYTLICWHFELILKSTYRRITLKQSLRHPFTVNITESIHKELYYQAFRAVRDYHTPFGTTSETIKDKKGFAKTYKLTFTRIQSLHFHLGKLSGKDDIKKTYLEKSFPHGEKGKIVVSVEEPAIFFFKTSTNTLTVTMKYQMTNQYGTVCSY